MDRDNISIQTIIGVIFVIAALAIVPAVISVLTESVDNQVTTKSLVEEASYIIYKDGDYTCAKNGTTGRIEVRSADASAAIQSAIDKMTGGVLYISPGEYSVSNVLVSENMQIIGSGQSTVLKLQDALSAVVAVDAATGESAVEVDDASDFDTGNNILLIEGGVVQSRTVVDVVGDVITFNGALDSDVHIGSHVFTLEPIIDVRSLGDSGCSISNIRFDGNRANQSVGILGALGDGVGASTLTTGPDHAYYEKGLVNVYDSSNVDVKNCVFDNSPSHGIFIWNGTDVNIDDNRLTDIGDKAICFHTPDPVNYILENINIRGNFISGTGKMIFGVLAGPGWGDGIQFHQLGRNVLIDGNYIEDVYRCGIQIKGDHFVVSNNILNDTVELPFGTSTFVSTMSLTDSIFTNNIINTPPSTRRNQTVIWNCDNSVVSDNLVTGGGYTGASSTSMLVQGHNVVVDGNSIHGSNAALASMRLVNVRNATVSNCIISDPARSLGSGIELSNSRYVTVTSCRVYDTLTPTENLGHSILMQLTSSNVVLRDCYLEKGRYGVGVYHSELVDMYEYREQVFSDVINHDDDCVHAFITGTGAAQEITTGISNPPGSRNIWVYCTNIASPTGVVVVEGYDQFNNVVSDTITIIPGGYAQGYQIFSKVTKVTVPAGVSASDRVKFGVADYFGLLFDITDSAQIYKCTKNHIDWTSGVNIRTAWDSVSFNNGAGVVDGDTYTIYYKLPLNIIV